MTSATTREDLISRWNTWRGQAWTDYCKAGPKTLPAPHISLRRWPGPCTLFTSRASFTAISSRPTSCCTWRTDNCGWTTEDTVPFRPWRSPFRNPRFSRSRISASPRSGPPPETYRDWLRHGNAVLHGARAGRDAREGRSGPATDIYALGLGSLRDAYGPTPFRGGDAGGYHNAAAQRRTPVADAVFGRSCRVMW